MRLVKAERDNCQFQKGKIRACELSQLKTRTVACLDEKASLFTSEEWRNAGRQWSPKLLPSAMMTIYTAHCFTARNSVQLPLNMSGVWSEWETNNFS